MRIIVQCLLCLLLFSATGSAWAVEPEDIELEEEPVADERPKKRKPTKKKRRKKAPAETLVIEARDPEPAPKPRRKPRKARQEVVVPADEEEDEESEAPVDAGGLECSPAVSEVETRRPIPISCGVTREGVSSIEIRYKTPGKRKFTRLVLSKTGTEWTGEIPCGATTKTGELKLQFNAKGKGNKLVARIGTVTVRLVESSREPPPSLPGQEPPMRCYDNAECPAEFKGTPACPGTKPGPKNAKSWGASCGSSEECKSGLSCIKGTCEQAPKCDTTEDCPSGGECSDGACEFPDPEELASRLEPRHNWIGVHFGVDLALVSDAAGVCGQETKARADYACFQAGDPYEGPANEGYSGNVQGGFRMATMRVMLSYERWFGRFAAGARVGFAFGGAPEDFSPLHLEARVLYALRSQPLRKRFRPYLGLAAGLGQVDPKSKARLIDCSEAGNACRTADLEELMELGGVRELAVDAYRKGSALFFGPALGFYYALSDGHAFVFNANVMFPDVVVEPSIGYVLGL